jgi:hypothetical protein
VIIADWFVAMVPAVAVKEAVAAPAARVTDAGTGNKALLLESEIVTPPAGAIPFSVTVQEVAAAVITVLGVQLTKVSATGPSSETTVVCGVPPLKTAVIFADWGVALRPADAVKVPEEDPAGILTSDGTVSRPLLLESVTGAPKPVAGADNVTVQVVEAPDGSEL